MLLGRAPGWRGRLWRCDGGEELCRSRLECLALLLVDERRIPFVLMARSVRPGSRHYMLAEPWCLSCEMGRHLLFRGHRQTAILALRLGFGVGWSYAGKESTRDSMPQATRKAQILHFTPMPMLVNTRALAWPTPRFPPLRSHTMTSPSAVILPARWPAIAWHWARFDRRKPRKLARKLLGHWPMFG